MADGDSLKQRNLPWLSFYVFLHAIALAWVLLGTPVTVDTLKSVAAGEWEKAAASLALGFVTVLLNRLFGSRIKNVVVFWRLRNPLPSSRFVGLIAKDPRIDRNRLAQNIGIDPTDFPKAPDDQTRLWYRLYRKHEATPSVRANHHEYLLLRDFTWLTIVLAVFGGTGALWVTSIGRPSLIYTSVSAAIFLVFRFAAESAAERFVLTVLASESAEVGAQPRTYAKGA